MKKKCNTRFQNHMKYILRKITLKLEVDYIIERKLYNYDCDKGV